VKLTPHQITEAIRRRDAGEPLTEIARSYNVSHSTISRLPAEAGAVEIRGRTAAAKMLAPPLALLSTQQRLSNGDAHTRRRLGGGGGVHGAQSCGGEARVQQAIMLSVMWVGWRRPQAWRRDTPSVDKRSSRTLRPRASA
jgi:hypothetical protein